MGIGARSSRTTFNALLFEVTADDVDGDAVVGIGLVCEEVTGEVNGGSIVNALIRKIKVLN